MLTPPTPLQVLATFQRCTESGYCHCGCGKKTKLHTTSCARLGQIRGQPRNFLKGHASSIFNARHRGRGTPEYQAWIGMRVRCNNPKARNFHDYGGRGITVCDKWNASFEAFRDDMGLRPSPDHSLDRIDNSKGYFPNNCRWATPSEQQSNRRNACLITALGETLNLSAWSKRLGVAPYAIRNRIKAGWSLEDAVSRPPRPYPRRAQ